MQIESEALPAVQTSHVCNCVSSRLARGLVEGMKHPQATKGPTSLPLYLLTLLRVLITFARSSDRKEDIKAWIFWERGYFDMFGSECHLKRLLPSLERARPTLEVKYFFIVLGKRTGFFSLSLFNVTDSFLTITNPECSGCSSHWNEKFSSQCSLEGGNQSHKGPCTQIESEALPAVQTSHACNCVPPRLARGSWKA
ncbi:hypothetical protein CEXT_494771 [Caerostris extrusa]|uniref:Uncharacterized protein n=1 Tax=Caerostris extrusa TaxID=172846 RepID=A0AAV4NAZ1_CAEEX|nr:hypothetical protein CEXT_494771 [Caerostris extrusa]